MKGMNTSPRLEESLSYRATYLSVQKYLYSKNAYDIVPNGEVSTKGCMRGRNHQEAKSNSTALSMFGLQVTCQRLTLSLGIIGKLTSSVMPRR